MGARTPVPFLLLRGGLAIAALALFCRALPSLSDPLALLGIGLLGLLLAAPLWLDVAVRRGHDLRMLEGSGALTPWLSGTFWRIAWRGGAGVLLASALVLRLAGAPLGAWAWLALALPLTWALLAGAERLIGSVMRPLHSARLARQTAQFLAALILPALQLGLALWLGALPEARAPVEASGPLVTEALAFSRLWTGLEAFALAQATEFAGFSSTGAMLLHLALEFGASWGAAALAVALTLNRVDFRRALAPASDIPDAALAPSRTALATAAALVLTAVIAGGALGQKLGATPALERPSAQFAQVVDYIEGRAYRAGTTEALAALHRQALGENHAAREALTAALDGAFDAMERNVDPFLDNYYSLSADYLRLAHWALELVWLGDGLEAHLTSELTDHLQASDPFGPYTRLSDQFPIELEARWRALEAARDALLAENLVTGTNPARLIDSGTSEGILAPYRERLALDLSRTQLRVGASAGVGVLASVMAQRVVSRLAARGALEAVARGLTRVAGVIVALGVDAALVELDEYRNRDDFRAEIMAEIAALRAQSLAQLEPSESEAANTAPPEAAARQEEPSEPRVP